MKKLKVLLSKYEEKHLKHLMEIDFYESHNYPFEKLWAEKERDINLAIIADLRECLKGESKEV